MLGCILQTSKYRLLVFSAHLQPLLMCISPGLLQIYLLLIGGKEVLNSIMEEEYVLLLV